MKTSYHQSNYEFVKEFWGTPQNCMKAILAHVCHSFSGCRAPLNKNSTLFYAESRGA